MILGSNAPVPKAAHTWARDELDWYVDPTRVTTQLLNRERFVGPIHDPCCGGGNVIKALFAYGYFPTGSDLVSRGGSEREDWWTGAADYLRERIDPFGSENIICNPPYFGGKGTEAFIRRALDLANGKICVFVDRRFLTGKGRATGLFREHPPARVWEITPRPSCPPGAYLEAGNKAAGGTADYAWLVWDRTGPSGATALGWLTPDDLGPSPR